MSQGLFRQEVLDAKRGEWLGSIVVATPLSRWAWTLLGASLAATLLAFLVFGHYTRRESVSGQLVPSAGLINLAAINRGSVTRVWVRDGQSVRKGDPLIEISSDSDSAALGDTHALVGRQLELQQNHLQDDLGIGQRQTRQQVTALQAKIALLKAQQSELDGQLGLQRNRGQRAIAVGAH